MMLGVSGIDVEYCLLWPMLLVRVQRTKLGALLGAALVPQVVYQIGGHGGGGV
jgi:hypothetical protein